MNPIKRWRWWAVLVLPLVVIALNAFGPDGWREPVVRLLWLSWTSVAVAIALSASKAMADYAHGREAWQKSLEHPIGAGLSFLALCLLRSAMVIAIVWASMTQFANAAEPAGIQRARALAPMVVLFMVSNLLHYSFGVWLFDRRVRWFTVWKVPTVVAAFLGLLVSLTQFEVWPPLLTSMLPLLLTLASPCSATANTPADWP